MRWRALPISNQQTGDILNQYQGITLAAGGLCVRIWGLIYVGFIASAIFQACPTSGKPACAIGWPFVIVCGQHHLAALLHYNQFVLSMVAMRPPRRGDLDLPSVARRRPQSLTAARGGATAFSIYLSWITIALWQLAHVLVGQAGWGPLSPLAADHDVRHRAVIAPMAITQRDVAPPRTRLGICRYCGELQQPHCSSCGRRGRHRGGPRARGDRRARTMAEGVRRTP
jgi:hypothetical protein